MGISHIWKIGTIYLLLCFLLCLIYRYFILFKIFYFYYEGKMFANGLRYKIVIHLLLLFPLVCIIPLEHFRTIDYVHVREGRLGYLQKFTGGG
jgi:hypothetical protein